MPVFIFIYQDYLKVFLFDFIEMCLTNVSFYNATFTTSLDLGTDDQECDFNP